MVFSILYVCTGNICRSPLAERLLTMRLDAALGQRSSVFGVTSAGTHGWDGSEMDPAAASQLIRLGGDPAGFTGRQLTPEYEGERLGDVKHSLADIARARSGLGYSPGVSFSDGLRRTFSHYEERVAEKR